MLWKQVCTHLQKRVSSSWAECGRLSTRMSKGSSEATTASPVGPRRARTAAASRNCRPSARRRTRRRANLGLRGAARSRRMRSPEHSRISTWGTRTAPQSVIGCSRHWSTRRNNWSRTQPRQQVCRLCHWHTSRHRQQMRRSLSGSPQDRIQPAADAAIHFQNSDPTVLISSADFLSAPQVHSSPFRHILICIRKISAAITTACT